MTSGYDAIYYKADTIKQNIQIKSDTMNINCYTYSDNYSVCHIFR